MEKKPRRKKQQYSIADLINDITRVANESPGQKLSVSLYKSKGKYAFSTVEKRFGSWKHIVSQAGLKQFPIYTENDYLEDIKQVANQFANSQLTYSLYKKHGKFTRYAIIHKLGSWRNAIQKSGIINANNIHNYKFEITEEDLLNDLKQTYKHNKANETLSTYYAKNGKYAISTFYSKFGSLKNALEKAGLPHKNNKADDYIEDIKQVANQFPHLKLTCSLYDKHGKFSRYAIIFKLGSWSNAIQKSGIINDNNINIYKFKISEESLLNDLKQANQDKKDNETLQIYYRKNGNYGISIYHTRFGSWDNALEKAGLPHKNNIENQYIEDIRQVANQFPNDKLNCSFYTRHGKFSRTQICHKFGSWLSALQKAGIDNSNKKTIRKFKISENDLLNDLKQTNKLNEDNESLHVYYLKNGKYAISTYFKRFGNWKNALKKAGINNDYKIKNRKPRSSEEDLLNDLKQADKHKKSNESLRAYYLKNGKYSISTFNIRFGSWKNTLEKAGIKYENKRIIHKPRNSEEDLLNDLIQASKHKIANETLSSYYTKNGKYAISGFYRKFGSWKNALEKAGLLNKKVTENDCLEDIKQVANQFPDFQLTFSLYIKHGKFNRNHIYKKFHKWSNALQKAGINNDNKIKIPKVIASEEDLLNDLKQANKFKKSNESLMTYYRKNGKHAVSTYNLRFGSWKNALEKAGLLHKKT